MSVNWGELSAVVSVLSVVFFAGAWWQSSKHNKETIETIKESFKESISILEKNFQEKVESMKESFNTTIQGLKDTIEQNTKHTTEHIKNLELKQDKHNNVIERTFKIESDVEVIKEQIKVENHRIGDLEEIVK
jgi:hypothetical protein